MINSFSIQTGDGCGFRLAMRRIAHQFVNSEVADGNWFPFFVGERFSKMPTATPLPPPPMVGQSHPRSPKIDLPTKRRRKHQKRSKPRRDNRKSRYDADYTADDERNNPSLEAYYRAQKIVPEEEYKILFDTLATPLPTSFRITADGAFAGDIQKTLQTEMRELFERVGRQQMMENSKGGHGEKKEPIKPPAPLPWYPDNLAWSLSAPRQLLRRDNALSPFHKFLVRMNDIGAVNRQEAVSMIPPMVLQAKPGHAVLDMCAAPGSKTAQLLEAVSPPHKPLSQPGLVIANDADIKRCWMLAHQLKRFSSAELVVTHHDAQDFPMFMAFDRVLCDVPCTGDGTLRKAPDIWRRWTADMGIGIHRLQRRILERGIQLLKPGGRLVYSTCSMNPLENEAVVADALRRFGDVVELVESRDVVSGLKWRPGLKTWMVKNTSGNLEKLVEDSGKEATERKGEKETEMVEVSGDNGDSNSHMPDLGSVKAPEWFTSYDEVPHRRQKKIVKSLFPPTAAELQSGSFPLERCMRLVPHDQDTGAFFVSVFVKKENAQLTRRLRREEDKREKVENGEGDFVNAEGEGNAEKEAEEKTRDPPMPKKTGRGGTRLITDDPLVPVSELCPVTLKNMVEFFGMDLNLMEHCLMTRGSESSTFKQVVAVSRSVRTVLRHALGTKDTQVPAENRVLRVVNAGVKVLARTDRRDTTLQFRVVKEGARVMRAIMQKRCVSWDVALVYELLEKDVIRVAEDPRWTSLVEIGSGSAVLCVGEGEEVVVWVGKRVVNVVMPKEDIEALKMRLGRVMGKPVSMLKESPKVDDAAKVEPKIEEAEESLKGE